jgi:hypothetical protein
VRIDRRDHALVGGLEVDVEDKQAAIGHTSGRLKRVQPGGKGSGTIMATL